MTGRTQPRSVSRVDAELDRLDILSETVGAHCKFWEETTDGYGAIRLTSSLPCSSHFSFYLPKIRKLDENHNSNAEIVAVSTEVHFLAQPAEQNMDRLIGELNTKKSSTAATGNLL